MDLVNQAYKTVDDTKRAELIKQAATIEYNEGAYIVYGFDDQVDALAANVMGMVPDFSGLGSCASNARYRLAYIA